MTVQKTKSLTLSTNPVARLRELADLDAPVPPAHRTIDDSNAAAPQHSHNGSQQPDSASIHCPECGVIKICNIDTVMQLINRRDGYTS